MARLVDLTEHTCTCPDHEETRGKCKHQWAVEFSMRAVTTHADGSVSQTTVSVKYTQDWPSYNAAQCSEKEHVGTLLRALCEGVQQPAYKGRGRRPLPLADLIHSATMKVYTGLSGRRATTDIRDCAAKGLIDHAPHYNSVHNVIERADVTPVLKALIEESAVPLKVVDGEAVAADSTGFSTSVYDRWFDQKYGQRKERTFVKAHALVGTVTNAVLSVEVTPENVNDCPVLPTLLQSAVAKGWAPEEVSADKGYLSNKNLQAIEAIGAVPFIPFKSNSKGAGPAAWRLLALGDLQFQFGRMAPHVGPLPVQARGVFDALPSPEQRRDDVRDDQEEVWRRGARQDPHGAGQRSPAQVPVPQPRVRHPRHVRDGRRADLLDRPARSAPVSAIDPRVRELIRWIAVHAAAYDVEAPIVEFFVGATETLTEIGRLFGVSQDELDEIVDEAHDEAHAASESDR